MRDSRREAAEMRSQLIKLETEDLEKVRNTFWIAVDYVYVSCQISDACSKQLQLSPGSYGVFYQNSKAFLFTTFSQNLLSLKHNNHFHALKNLFILQDLYVAS